MPRPSFRDIDDLARFIGPRIADGIKSGYGVGMSLNEISAERAKVKIDVRELAEEILEEVARMHERVR